MKFSYNWISELIDGLDTPPAAVGDLITRKTAECEGVEPYGAMLSQVCVARVLTAERIEGTHLTRTQTETGRYGVRQVVCGAPNCREGLLTAYWPLGRKSVRGMESDGMLASPAELGIGGDEDGILELTEGTPGEPLSGLLPDTIIEIDNKSLTHRPDLWGHYGMAREVAAISGRPLRDPVDLSLLPQGEPAIAIEIGDFALCPRFSALAFENVTVQPSPPWLQYRLQSVGLNPINNIVDVTNWVMAELAQPMHAYDGDKLQGGTLIARTAGAGESCEALNGATYSLDASNLVIADASGPVGIAGVIGGGPSAITESTTRVVLEAANFQAASIRKTSARIKLRTDASMRFEKSQDPANTVRGLARAIALLQIVSPGIRCVGGLADNHRVPAPPPAIAFAHAWMERKLGRTIGGQEVEAILKSLCFGVERRNGQFSVTVPTWRATRDISIKDDLVEEVGRMVGYDSIAPLAPQVPARVPPSEPTRLFQRRIRATLAAQGFHEVYNYSFVNEAQAAQFRFSLDHHVRVLNPIAAGQELLRTSLLPNLLKNIEFNRHYFERFRLFEIGNEIHKAPQGLPDQAPRCAVAIYARGGDGRAELMELKRIAAVLMEGSRTEPAEALSYEHPQRAGTVHWNGRPVGRLFEFHPGMVESGRAQVLYLDPGAMESAQPEVRKFVPVPRFPTSEFDITLPVAPRARVADLLSRIDGIPVAHLLAVEYLYDYSDADANARTMTFRFQLGAKDRTLGPEEIATAREQLRTALA